MADHIGNCLICSSVASIHSRLILDLLTPTVLAIWGNTLAYERVEIPCISKASIRWLSRPVSCMAGSSVCYGY